MNESRVTSLVGTGSILIIIIIITKIFKRKYV